MTDLHPNFFENLKEAQIRLQNTVVMYDSLPYYVICLADYKPDGIIRVYMEPVGAKKGGILRNYSNIPYEQLDSERGQSMDAWMVKYPDSGLIRKMMNSPAFNRFRPFDLGMCNSSGKAYYLERQPQRHTQQGLTQNMLLQEVVELEESPAKRGRYLPIGLQTTDFRDCVLGTYPTFDACVKNLLDPEIENNAAGFHRNFALVRGPIDTLFLAYKSDVVGCLPYGDARTLRLSHKFAHVKEATDDLRIFDDILIK